MEKRAHTLPGLLDVHAYSTEGATFSREGRLENPGAASLGYPHLLCDVGAAAAPWCTLDSGDALLHMRAAQRQEGGQGSHHPAQEDDAALFRLQQQWFFPDQRNLSTAGQF